MNRIVRSIIMALTALITTTSCSPDAKSVWYGGKVTNSGDRTLYVALSNPDPEYGPGSKDDYTRQIELRDGGGSATYWLHERGKATPYVFFIYDIDGVLKRKISVSPDGEANDHGSWSWTVNAATGAVQYAIMTPYGVEYREYTPGDSTAKIVRIH